MSRSVHMATVAVHIEQIELALVGVRDIKVETRFDSVGEFPISRGRCDSMSRSVLIENPITLIYPFVGTETLEVHFSMMNASKPFDSLFRSRNILEIPICTGMTP